MLVTVLPWTKYYHRHLFIATRYFYVDCITYKTVC
uniref:Uncharacterized protein n=1 Tax=Arundo donax TaxID=35708 RepID=A0A0A9F2F1_ARUDO